MGVPRAATGWLRQIQEGIQRPPDGPTTPAEPKPSRTTDRQMSPETPAKITTDDLSARTLLQGRKDLILLTAIIESRLRSLKNSHSDTRNAKFRYASATYVEPTILRTTVDNLVCIAHNS